MDSLLYIAIGFYGLMVFKVIAQLYRKRYDLKHFYDERMSLILGVFITVHLLAVLLWCAVTVIMSMMYVTL